MLLTKLVGTGKTALFIPLKRSGACEDEDTFKFVPAFEDRVVLPMAAQRLFLELLRAANRHLNVEPGRMVKLSMRQFTFVRDTEVDYFRVVRKDIVEDTDLPCPCRLTVGKNKVSSKDTSEIQLPFGIVVGMPAAKEKKQKRWRCPRRWLEHRLRQFKCLACGKKSWCERRLQLCRRHFQLRCGSRTRWSPVASQHRAWYTIS